MYYEKPDMLFVSYSVALVLLQNQVSSNCTGMPIYCSLL